MVTLLLLFLLVVMVVHTALLRGSPTIHDKVEE
jgi:hypothetical protein